MCWCGWGHPQTPGSGAPPLLETLPGGCCSTLSRTVEARLSSLHFEDEAGMLSQYNDQMPLKPRGLDALGFDVDDNTWHLFWEGGSCVFEQASKSQLARRLIELISRLYGDKTKAFTTDEHEQHSA